MKENNLQLAVPWSTVKEKIKEANIKLTDEDLQYTPGREEELLTHLSNKMNMTPAEIKLWIESLSENKGKAS